MELIPFLDKLSATSSTNEKKTLIKNLTEPTRSLFIDAVVAAHQFDVKFNLSKAKIPPMRPRLGNHISTIHSTAEVIEWVRTKGTTGGFPTKESVEGLKTFMHSHADRDQDLIRRIISKDLAKGVNAKIVNSVIPDTVFIPPYMRAKTFKRAELNKLPNKLMAQIKSDGKFMNVVFDLEEDTTEFNSRDWVESEHLQSKSDASMRAHMRSIGIESCVLMGEGVVLDDNGDVLDRQTGNGLLNSPDCDKDRIRFIIWDCIPIDDFFKGSCNIPYHDRLHNFVDKITDAGIDKFVMVDTYYIDNDIDDINRLYREVRTEGEEGLMIKDPTMPWKHGTSTKQFKCKVAVDCDMRIVGWEEGTGKYSGMVGAINIQSEDGRIDSWVGSGLTDQQRGNTSLIQSLVDKGAIANVRYNDVTTNEQRDVLSLYLPRIVELERSDKESADSTEKIIEQLTQDLL